MQNNNPKISVIMSAYNAQKYLKEAIESILNQTFRDFEFLIVEDGSTDETLKILEECGKKNERIKIISNSENIGLTKSLNKAIKLAKGKYIARMDADDVSLPERFEKQIAFMEKNPEIGLLGTACYEINSRGEIVGDKFPPCSDKELKKILIRSNPFAHPSVMLRREVFDKVGLYQESIPLAQDHELWFRVVRDYKTANLLSPLVMRRYSPNTISVARENEQIFWAQQARKEAIKRGQYSKWNYLWLFKVFLVSKIPVSWRRFIRKYLLKKKIYD